MTASRSPTHVFSRHVLDLLSELLDEEAELQAHLREFDQTRFGKERGSLALHFLEQVVQAPALVRRALVYKGLEGVPMLWVQPLDKQGSPKGEPLVACDSTRAAGTGELVYYEGGREAAMVLDPWFVPVDHAIIGIVDDLNIPP